MTDWSASQSRYERYKSEAEEWCISLSERLELEALSRSNLNLSKKFYSDDWIDLGFRTEVAEILIENGLAKKADRYLLCSRKGFILRCNGADRHEFFSPSYCDLRFCAICSMRQFARLYAKHFPVLQFIARNPRKGFRLRQITLTSKNRGVLVHDDITTFNEAVKKTLDVLMKSVEGWGAMAVLEVGFNNWNLHVHILAWCPYIEQARLARVWREVSGHQVVWINEEKVSGRKVLLYMLKYVSKPPSDNPEIIGQLEVAFHGTRRVHCYGLFYNFSGDDTDAENSKWMECPKCGAELERVRGQQFVYKLRKMGLEFIGDVRRERGITKWVN
jgi:hypothetical protein